MARMTVVEYRKCVGLLRRLVEEEPMQSDDFGGVACFFCQEQQIDPQNPVHDVRCPWLAAQKLLKDYEE